MTQRTSVAEVKKNRIIYLILGLMCLLPGILYATKSPRRLVKIAQTFDKVAKKIEREVIKEIDLTALTSDEGVCLACEG